MQVTNSSFRQWPKLCSSSRHNDDEGPSASQSETDAGAVDINCQIYVQSLWICFCELASWIFHVRER